MTDPDILEWAFAEFKRTTGSNCVEVDFYWAFEVELNLARTVFPTDTEAQRHRKVLDTLVGAFSRAKEYNVKLRWESIARALTKYRPAILWAVCEGLKK